MPTYQIDTDFGTLEIDHDGPVDQLLPAVKNWTAQQAIAKAAPDSFWKGGDPSHPPSGADLNQIITQADPNALAPGMAVTEEIFSLATPIVTSTAELSRPMLNIPEPKGGGALAGVAAGAARTVSGLTSIDNLQTLIEGAILPPPLQKIVGGAFGAKMIKDAPEQFSDALQLKDPKERAAGVTQSVLGFLMGVAGLKFALGESRAGLGTRGPSVPEKELDNALKEAARERPSNEQVTDDQLDGTLAAIRATDKAIASQPENANLPKLKTALTYHISDVKPERIAQSKLRSEEETIAAQKAGGEEPPQGTESKAQEPAQARPPEEGNVFARLRKEQADKVEPVAPQTAEALREAPSERPDAETLSSTQSMDDLNNLARKYGLSEDTINEGWNVQGQDWLRDQIRNAMERKLGPAVKTPEYSSDLPDPRLQKVIDSEVQTLHASEGTEEMMEKLEAIEDVTVRQGIARQYGIDSTGKSANDLNVEIAEKAAEVKDVAAPKVEPPETPEDDDLVDRQYRSLPGGGKQARKFWGEGGEMGFSMTLGPAPPSMVTLEGIWKQMRGTADMLRRFVGTGELRDRIAGRFDAAENQAGYTARQESNSVRLATKGMPEEDLAQRAATFVRQANGDKAGMIAKLDAIRGKGFDKEINYAIKNWDALEKAATAAKSATDRSYAEAVKKGMALDYRDNYVKGAYDFPFENKVIFDELAGGRGTGTSFKKPKVFNDYAEAIAAGYKPKELRLDKLTESAVQTALRAANRRAWGQSLNDFQMPDGKPAAIDMQNGKVPKGYRAVQITPGTLVAIHDEIAPTIERLTRPSILPKALLQAHSGIKHNILVWDTYHGSRFAQMYAAFTGKAPTYGKGLALLEYADRDLDEAVKGGEISKDEAKWARDNRPQFEGLVKEGLNAGRISDALYKDIAPLMPGAKQVNHFIFERLSRGLITQASLYALERNRRLNPGIPEPELNRMTAKEVNTYFRNLGTQGIFKSKSFQDAARLLLFAPQWIEGMVRSESAGYVGAAKLPFTGKTSNITAAMGKGLVMYLAATQLINLLTRGKPTWENPEPGHKMDAWVPDKMQGSNGFFISPLSVFAEVTHDFLKYSERGQTPREVTFQLAKNKLSPEAQSFITLSTGKDFFGRPLKGMDVYKEAAQNVMPIPLTFRGTQYKGAQQRQLMQAGGIKAVPAASSTSNIYALAEEFKRSKGIPQQEHAASEYQPLVRALADGNTDTAREERDKLLKTKKPEVLSKYFASLTGKTFTGSKSLEEEFRQNLDREQMEIYNSALREKEEVAKQYFLMSGDNPPGKKRKIGQPRM